MNKCNCEVRYRTINCSEDYYKREFKSLMKHFSKFLYLVYKYYLQKCHKFSIKI